MCIILYKQITSSALGIIAEDETLFLRGFHNLQGKVAISCYILLTSPMLVIVTIMFEERYMETPNNYLLSSLFLTARNW